MTGIVGEVCIIMATMNSETAAQQHSLEMQRRRMNLDASQKDFLAGAVAGALAIATTQPLDIVRVRLQQSAGASTSGATSQPGVLASLRHMVRAEGVLAPFKGMAMPLAFSSLQNAIIFNIYGSTMRLLQRMESSSSVSNSSSSSGGNSSSSEASSSGRVIPKPWHGFVAGCVAGFGQVFAWSPVELVKLRLQLQTVSHGQPGYIGPLQMLKRIATSEGIPGLYRGFTVTVLRDIPSYGVYFGVYHSLCTAMEGPCVHPEDAKPLTLIVAGGTAGCCAWTSIYYLDVIKSRMQAVTRTQDGGRTWLDYGREVIREGGLRAFTRGMAPTLVRAFIMDAASFLGYTYSLRTLHTL